MSVMISTIPFYVAGVIVILLMIWAVGSWWVVRDIEQPTYTVLAAHNDYEVRRYSPYIVAETTVDAETEREALTEGFRIVANYIFGNNTTNEKVSMTSPVLASPEAASGEGDGEEIAMTAPVLAAGEGGTRSIAFVMPSAYTLESLPEPNDDRVVLREVPEQTVAVRQFSWYATDARITAQKKQLLTVLNRDNIEATGLPLYAGYNPPLTIPFIQRHEVQVPIVFE